MVRCFVAHLETISERCKSDNFLPAKGAENNFSEKQPWERSLTGRAFEGDLAALLSEGCARAVYLDD